MFVGDVKVPLKLNAQSHMLEAPNGGFDVAVFSRVQPKNEADFSMYQVDLAQTGLTAKPIARSVGTIDGLVALAKIQSREVTLSQVGAGELDRVDRIIRNCHIGNICR
jgi:hypothetical protein